LLPDFARGLLAGGGHVGQSHITWCGTRQAMWELQQLIRAATGVGAPLVGREGKRHTVTWVDTNEVTALRRWLRSQG
jgi:hypothetical protein